MPQFSLHMGALSDRIADQLTAQNVEVDHVGHWQKKADAITMLHVTQILTDSETDKARERFMKQIARETRTVTHTEEKPE